jgi:hypothetical protein
MFGELAAGASNMSTPQRHSPATPERGRLFCFSLRAMFIAIALISVLFALVVAGYRSTAYIWRGLLEVPVVGNDPWTTLSVDYWVLGADGPERRHWTTSDPRVLDDLRSRFHIEHRMLGPGGGSKLHRMELTTSSGRRAFMYFNKDWKVLIHDPDDRQNNWGLEVNQGFYYALMDYISRDTQEPADLIGHSQALSDAVLDAIEEERSDN